MRDGFNAQFRACGRDELPESLSLGSVSYRLDGVFKHDFFAATALYQRESARPQANSPQANSPQANSPQTNQPQLDNNGSAANDSPGNDANAGNLPTIPPPANLTPASNNQPPPAALPEKVVFKVARSGDFFGIPLAWLGRELCRHEVTILKRLQGIQGVPRLMEQQGPFAFSYAFIEGTTLDEKPTLPDSFFDQLAELLQAIHDREVVYVDMNKRGNILLGNDGRAHMIDFQIACHWPDTCFGSKRLTCRIRDLFRKEDWYHLAKHKRRFRSDLMTPEEYQASKRVSPWITFHRRLTRPLLYARRAVLNLLVRRRLLQPEKLIKQTPESDPNRWNK